MKNFVYCTLFAVMCGSMAYAEDAKDNANETNNSPVNTEHTWDDGTPMTDSQYEHMLDVYKGFDSN